MHQISNKLLTTKIAMAKQGPMDRCLARKRLSSRNSQEFRFRWTWSMCWMDVTRGVQYV